MGYLPLRRVHCFDARHIAQHTKASLASADVMETGLQLRQSLLLPALAGTTFSPDHTGSSRQPFYSANSTDFPAIYCLRLYAVHMTWRACCVYLL